MTHTNRSPTDSHESRQNWAYYQRCILEEQHRTHPPTHEAVIKFHRPVKVETLKQFTKGFREKLAYWVRSTGEEFAVFFVIEADPSNRVHYHFLIRTSETHPWMLLNDIVKKASEEMASLKHCEQIETVEAISRYMVKDIAAACPGGEKEVVLFRKGLGLRQVGSFNHYFTISKRALWEQSKRRRYGAEQKSRRTSQ